MRAALPAGGVVGRFCQRALSALGSKARRLARVLTGDLLVPNEPENFHTVVKAAAGATTQPIACSPRLNRFLSFAVLFWGYNDRA